ncbi:acyltransferase family protein [Brevundimonas vesicularis]|uniref:acyltransferase family protein n=1 Tax=Brevundimonas vesicularis TaxID=41276 RepID=UPI0022ABFECB|nr:acyltransferase [Brevundimonas vesicularis]
MGERFHGVQALRFAAATAVVVTHAVDLAGTRLGLETVLAGGTLENFGAVGVDVFFVISGFIIATTTQGQTGVGAAGAFLWRRLRRVAPIYWLLSLPILVGMARGGTLSPQVAAATFLFWPFSGLEMTFPALGPGWTLCFEMLFYAGFGLAIAGRAMAGGRRGGCAGSRGPRSRCGRAPGRGRSWCFWTIGWRARRSGGASEDCRWSVARDRLARRRAVRGSARPCSWGRACMIGRGRRLV